MITIFKSFLFLVILISQIYSLPLDSNVFKYFPLNVGNRWTWYVYRNFSPGPGYETEMILNTKVIRNHLYYKFQRDIYIYYGNQHYTGFSYNRIDSLNGNLYNLYINNNDSSDCLIDSLNSSVDDSTSIGCFGTGQWYRYSIGTYNIFNNTYPTKKFSYSTYFEGGDYHQYGKGIGPVYEIGQYVMSTVSKTLRGCIINGTIYGDTTVYLGINQISTEIPENFSLFQNYPNPFNPITKIKFAISGSSVAQTFLSVYNVLGHEVAVLINQQLQPGSYDTEWDASAYPSGVYYYKLEAGSFTETKKMVLIK